MKIISLLIISIFFLIFLPLPVYSQTEQLLFAVTPYHTREDIDILFAQSVHPLEYLEGKQFKTPLFLSIITPQQKKELIKARFTPTIIDDNAGEITQYYLLEHGRQDGYQLKGFDVAYQISDYHTIIKLPRDKIFDDVQTGVLTSYAPRQFTDDLVQPPMRTKNHLTPAPPPVSITPLAEKKPSRSLPWMAYYLPFILMAGAFISYTYYKKAQHQNPPQQ